MTEEQLTVLAIKGMIASLPAASGAQAKALAEHFRRMVADAGDVVGPLALALVGAELEAEGFEALAPERAEKEKQ